MLILVVIAVGITTAIILRAMERAIKRLFHFQGRIHRPDWKYRIGCWEARGKITGEILCSRPHVRARKCSICGRSEKIEKSVEGYAIEAGISQDTIFKNQE